MMLIFLLILLVNLKNSGARDTDDCKEKYLWKNFNINEKEFLDYRYTKVSDCETVNLTLNLPKRIFETPESWKLKFNTPSIGEINLNLQKVDSVVFINSTKIYFADVDYKQHDIYSVAPSLENAIAYHDVNNSHPAALIVFNSKNGLIVEGFIGLHTLRYISSEEKYILSKIRVVSTESKPNPPHTINDANDFDLKGTVNPNIAYVPLLIALDFTFIQHQEPPEVLKNLLLYYNAVDLIFANFTSPKIKIHIGGVIIPKNANSVPYLRKKTIRTVATVPYEQFNETSYFSNVQNFSSYSNFIVMTGSIFSLGESFSTYDSKYCFTKTSSNVNKDLPIVGCVIRHPKFSGDHLIAAFAISSILHQRTNAQLYNCTDFYRLDNVYSTQPIFRWSKCSVTRNSALFNSIQFQSPEWELFFRKPEYMISEDVQGSSVGMILGVLFGVLAIILLLGFLGLRYIKYKRERLSNVMMDSRYKRTDRINTSDTEIDEVFTSTISDL